MVERNYETVPKSLLTAQSADFLIDTADVVFQMLFSFPPRFVLFPSLSFGLWNILYAAPLFYNTGRSPWP